MSENSETGKNASNGGDAKLFWGRAVCGLAMVLAGVGVIATLFGMGAGVVPGTVGAALGILGYFLGVNRLGTITIILCTAVVFFGLAAGQGLIPGVEAYNHPPDNVSVAGWEPTW